MPRTATLVLSAALLLSCVYAHSEPLSALLEWPDNLPQGLPTHAKQPGENAFWSALTPITHTGTNAEAYWSFDGRKLSMQAIRAPYASKHPCDLIYTLNADGSDLANVSGPEGRTTCSFFYPSGKQLLYSSTRSGGPWCPPAPDMAYGYVWPLNKDMDIWLDSLNGTREVLFASDTYDAEAVISPDGSRIIFTSAKDGDLELYTMNLDGSEVRRMTYTPGYDGGAWFSWDSEWITWRASRPRGDDYLHYKALLDFGMVEPANMQIYIQRADLTQPAIQLTNNAGTNFAPVFTPDNSAVMFSSDMHAPNQGTFHLYLVDVDGTNLRQVTTEGHFNSFAMFSPDGTQLAFESDRGTKRQGDINVFIAKWKL